MQTKGRNGDISERQGGYLIYPIHSQTPPGPPAASIATVTDGQVAHLVDGISDPECSHPPASGTGQELGTSARKHLFFAKKYSEKNQPPIVPVHIAGFHSYKSL
jgi:hypothetical protein